MAAVEREGGDNKLVKILITGSSGMLGTELCEVLGVDNEIIGVDLIKSKSKNQKAKSFYKEDITNLKAIKDILDKENPELIIHTAAWTDVDGCEENPDKAYEANVLGTENIIRSIGKRNIPVVFISTDFIFDGKKKGPYVEDDAAGPLNVYGKTKMDAENLFKKASLYAIVRTSWLYGRNGKNFVDTIISEWKIERHLKVVNDQVGSPTYAKDLAMALKALIDVPGVFDKQIYHITNTGRCSWYDFAVEILTKLETVKEGAIDPISSLELSRPARRPAFSVLDNTKFEKVAGHKLRSWREALANYMEEQ